MEHDRALGLRVARDVVLQLPAAQDEQAGLPVLDEVALLVEQAVRLHLAPRRRPAVALARPALLEHVLQDAGVAALVALEVLQRSRDLDHLCGGTAQAQRSGWPRRSGQGGAQWASGQPAAGGAGLQTAGEVNSAKLHLAPALDDLGIAPMVRMVEAEAGSPFCSCISACWSASRAELICATHMRGQPSAAVAHRAPRRRRARADQALAGLCTYRLLHDLRVHPTRLGHGRSDLGRSRVVEGSTRPEKTAVRGPRAAAGRCSLLLRLKMR